MKLLTLAGLGMLMSLPVAAQDMFFYPSQGQSPEQQSQDQGECQTWAQQQALAAQQAGLAQFNRALAACMQGRGYGAS